MRRSLHNKNNGNAAIAVIVLLLIAGAAAWWFLFRTPAATVLPGDSNARETRGDSAYRSGTGPEQGSAKEMDAASSGGSQVSSISDLSPTDHAIIDWKARHAELKQKYSDEFTEPLIGTKAKVLLTSGNVAEGTINDLTRDSITLRIAGTGKATYNRSQISPRSQLLLFKEVFAEYSAQEKIAAEKADLQSAAPPQ